MAGVLASFRRLKDSCWHALSSRFARWTKPFTSSLLLSTLADLSRSKSELVAENALLLYWLLGISVLKTGTFVKYGRVKKL